MPKALHPLLRGLGARIRQLRENHGWSQEELADRAGIDRSYMSGIERGVRNPTFLRLASIARAVGVAAKDLIPDR